MITGAVNANLELILPVTIQAGNNASFTFDAAIDTGFDDYLSIPLALARSLGLGPPSARYVTMADGSVVRLDEYQVTLEWDGQMVSVAALALGDGVLVGTKLLEGFKLTAEMKPGGAVTIEALP